MAWTVERQQALPTIPVALVVAAGGATALLALLRWADHRNLSLAQLIRALEVWADERP